MINDNWNNIVDKDDIVYHLGNFKIDYDNLDEPVNRINGEIYLIHSNHEVKSMKLRIGEILFFFTRKKCQIIEKI